MSASLLNKLKSIERKLPPAGRPLVLEVVWRTDAVGDPGPALKRSVQYRGEVGGPLARVKGSEAEWAEDPVPSVEESEP
jgi:hypothetical protein